MKALVQRAKRASVKVDGELISEIDSGLLIFLGVIKGDTDADRDYLLKKCSGLRIFDDENGVPNLNVKDAGGEILVVSQFTLAASTRKGNRPSYIEAALPEEAERVYNEFCLRLGAESGVAVKLGKFRANMEVSLINDGPMTIMIDSAAR